MRPRFSHPWIRRGGFKAGLGLSKAIEWPILCNTFSSGSMLSYNWKFSACSTLPSAAEWVASLPLILIWNNSLQYRYSYLRVISHWNLQTYQTGWQSLTQGIRKTFWNHRLPWIIVIPRWGRSPKDSTAYGKANTKAISPVSEASTIPGVIWRQVQIRPLLSNNKGEHTRGGLEDGI